MPSLIHVLKKSLWDTWEFYTEVFVHIPKQFNVGFNIVGSILLYAVLWSVGLLMIPSLPLVFMLMVGYNTNIL